ncbi:hypothetical protein BKA83DRAFT_4120857 [Pisolithus microcarpus]|nr:hypothetical protein BKA83DRAFT_4120857 [Pisolithus microcarpus]
MFTHPCSLLHTTSTMIGLNICFFECGLSIHQQQGQHDYIQRWRASDNPFQFYLSLLSNSFSMRVIQPAHPSRLVTLPTLKYLTLNLTIEEGAALKWICLNQHTRYTCTFCGKVRTFSKLVTPTCPVERQLFCHCFHQVHGSRNLEASLMQKDPVECKQ